jgi:ATP-binding cassette, subfamily G (WHITE), member 2, SNQ2
VRAKRYQPKLLTSCFIGKTTCLDVLAQRKNVGVVKGDMLVGQSFERCETYGQFIDDFSDGRPLNVDFARGTAYGVLD